MYHWQRWGIACSHMDSNRKGEPQWIKSPSTEWDYAASLREERDSTAGLG